MANKLSEKEMGLIAEIFMEAWMPEPEIVTPKWHEWKQFNKDNIIKDLKEGKDPEDIAAEAGQPLPEPLKNKLRVYYPEKFIADVSEIKRKLSKVPVDGQIWTIGKMNVDIALTPYTDGKNPDKEPLEPLTEFDKLVYQSICSYIDSGIGSSDLEIDNELRFFTPGMIYENMNPHSRKDLTSDSAAIEKVRKSIDKMRHIKLTLEYSKYIEKTFSKKSEADQKQGFLRNARVEDDWLLNAKKTPFKLNGEWVDGYRLNVVPAMYWKQKTMVRQLATYERRLLSTPNMKDATGDLLPLKHFVLEHIQSMKHSPKLSRKISYTSAYRRIGVEYMELTLRQRQSKRQQFKKYLDFLVKEGTIKGYSEYKKNQTIEGVEFEL